MPASIRQQLLVACATLALALGGCASNERPACGTTEDCPEEGQICRAGACTMVSQPTCSSESDCDPGFVCVASICERADITDEDTGTPDADEEPDAFVPDTNTDPDVEDPDTEQPRVTHVIPIDGARNVPTDTEVRVTFSKAIDAFRTLNIQSFFIADPDALDSRLGAIPVDIEYLEDERQAVLTPRQPLRPATQYTIIVTTGVQDQAQPSNPLFRRFESTFVTNSSEPAELTELAATYAPIIYQDTRLVEGSEINIDIPTRIDFDGDFDTDNNLTNARASATRPVASVYYSVTQTESHHYIHYSLYYPARRRVVDGSQRYYEHDFTSMVVAVNRASGDVDFVEGLKAESAASNDKHLSYRPDSSPVRGRGTNSADTFADALLEEGARYPLFVPSGEHAGCNWYVRPSGWTTECPYGNASFATTGIDAGFILRPGDQGQTFDQATENPETGLREFTYELVPFVNEIWSRRADFSCGVFDGVGFSYNPEELPSNPRPVGPTVNNPLYLPVALCSEAEQSFGRTPFSWFSGSSYSGGAWFMDPAFALSTRFNFGEGFSMDYCYNRYFDVDRRAEAACAAE
ncbi:Ig-like domain-containing protein [Lujinxingia litoralis]|nr:Ig-like domain-containing protein [Lujinxingia litoralis]